MITQDEAFAKNLELSFEFDRYLIDHPKFAEKIPFNVLVVLLPQYDRKLSAYNKKAAQQNREPKQPVVYIEIAGMRPHKSRLLQPNLYVKNGKSVPAKKRTTTQF
ncbi:MAG: DUF5647 family protein [candidate division KSB1 bacterium]